MKKKIAILGSTGTIGKTLLNIIDKDKKNFEILLLSAHSDYKTLLNQAKKFKTKNLILTNEKSFNIVKNKNFNKKIKIYNSFESFNKIFKKKKIDYVMSSIVGLEGLYPTIKIIQYTKKIAIANKESIICAWNLIYKELKKNNTEFIPVDSEHFSIWYALKNKLNFKIEKIYLTASGGSLLNVPKNQFNYLKLKKILNHPNWKMGKKITIDSSTLMNKVFEIIEAKKIFNIGYNKLGIIIHPQSYIHALLKFSDGMIKIIAHDTTMKIPIFNSIYNDNKKKLKFNNINFNKLNKLDFRKVDEKKFKLVKILKSLPNNNSLFETVLVSTNDKLVDLFIKGKINFTDIQKTLFLILKNKEFTRYKKIIPSNVNEIIKLNKYVHLKVLEKVYKSKNA